MRKVLRRFKRRVIRAALDTFEGVRSFCAQRAHKHYWTSKVSNSVVAFKIWRIKRARARRWRAIAKEI